MALSVENLAARLDALEAHGAIVTEGEISVTVSGLSVEIALEIERLCSALGWETQIEDNAGTIWEPAGLDVDFAPFRLAFDKPAAAADTLRLLTNTGFTAWLERGDGRAHWQVAGLTATIETYAVTFAPWMDDAALGALDDRRREARNFVRETGGQRLVPANMSCWLLADRDAFPAGDRSADIWATIAARKLMLALPNEIDAETRKLRFKGPPRLDLVLPAPGADLLTALGRGGFLELQASLDWVFEIEREAEMRHILLAAELARSGGTGEFAAAFLKDNIGDAVTGARAAYQLQLAGMSSDALKTLGELRKTVSDDTAKVAESTRQIITAVAGALAIGVGLIAARIAGNVSPTLVKIVLALAAAYVAITILAGVLFALLQRSVRAAWRPRLYRFLSQADYTSLVGGPANFAERALWICSALGTLAVILMIVVATQVEPPAAPATAPTTAQGSIDRPALIGSAPLSRASNKGVEIIGASAPDKGTEITNSAQAAPR